MPLLQFTVTSTSETVTLMQQVNAKHLHLKMVSFTFDALPTVETMVELQVPWLRHYYQVNSSSKRANLQFPLSHDLKTSTIYPDVVFVGENIDREFKCELLNVDGSGAWTDATATLQSATFMFEYSVE